MHENGQKLENYYKRRNVDNNITSDFRNISIVCTGQYNNNQSVSTTKEVNSFTLFDTKSVAPLVIDQEDYPGVEMVSNWFINDLKLVSGKSGAIYRNALPQTNEIVLVGTLGKNRWIDQLVKAGKIDISDFEGQWERSLTQVIENPFPGIHKALVLAGSDKRGTIYAMLNLSREMGVSPWYWWADVPVEKKDQLYVKAGRWVTESPKVKNTAVFS